MSLSAVELKVDLGLDIEESWRFGPGAPRSPSRWLPESINNSACESSDSVTAGVAVTLDRRHGVIPSVTSFFFFFFGQL
jgi:hypothetical protein